MRVVVSLVAMAGLLAGCGGGLTGDAKEVHDLCTSNGGEKAYCDCVTAHLQQTLTPEAFTKVGQADDGGDLEGTLDLLASAHAVCAATKP